LVSTTKEKQQIEEKLEDLAEQGVTLQETTPPLAKDSKSIEAEIGKLLARKLEQIDAKKKHESLLDALEFWVKGFGSTGIRNLLVRGILPKLNQHLARFADILTNGELRVEFIGETTVGSGSRVSSRNKLEVKVTDRYGSDKYYKESSGERRRVDLAVALAINFLVSTRVGLPFIVMDEIFASLDDSGKQNVMMLLEDLKKDIPTIIVISNTSDVLDSSFDSTWTVCRKGKQSYIEVS
jgi:DNA repair exonuclease SbcCD ATPase subunit